MHQVLVQWTASNQKITNFVIKWLVNKVWVTGDKVKKTIADTVIHFSYWLENQFQGCIKKQVSDLTQYMGVCRSLSVTGMIHSVIEKIRPIHPTVSVTDWVTD